MSAVFSERGPLDSWPPSAPYYIPVNFLVMTFSTTFEMSFGSTSWNKTDENHFIFSISVSSLAIGFHAISSKLIYCSIVRQVIGNILFIKTRSSNITNVSFLKYGYI